MFEWRWVVVRAERIALFNHQAPLESHYKVPRN